MTACSSSAAAGLWPGRGPDGAPSITILQEAITLAVFIPFAVFYMKQPLRLDYFYAALCILGAVYFVFRSPQP